MCGKNRISMQFFWVSALLVFSHFVLFQQFFPNQSGGLGHDYSLFLPALLDGAFWQDQNGAFSLQWFTPAFCGGLPKLANPNAAYLSVPQFLTYYWSPLSSVKLTLLLFSAFGYAGMYLLLRRGFGCNRLIALLGAVLFLFNGMYAHRMAVGHLTYHAFMFVPLVACLIINAARRMTHITDLRWLSRLTLASICIAYMVFSGMINLVVPSMLAVLAICLMALLVTENKYLTKNMALAYGLASIIAVMLSCFQLVATASYLFQFPRDLYPLPGIPNVIDIIHVIARSLFFEPAYELQESVRVNAKWAVERHELEYGVTAIPAVLIFASLVASMYSMWRAGVTTWVSKVERLAVFNRKKIYQVSLITAIFVVVCLPIALMYYSPEWNAFLKRVPIIGSTSTLVRWYALYIPLVVIVGCLAAKRTLASYSYFVVVSSVAYVLISNVLVDRTFYHKQNYSPISIEQAYFRLKNQEIEAKIEKVSGHDLASLSSNIRCYEPVFGYLLERYPQKYLQTGRPLDTVNGVLNIKNPACYQYPNDNSCEAGDHFSMSEIDKAADFIAYKPFIYSQSSAQRYANMISLISFLCVCMFLGFEVGRKIVIQVRRITLKIIKG